ncbi:MAG: SusC/RagA family TonB-linked outer membrane protein [Prevotella sp.]|nr:SusC/RagA family TonB-linked outer membrane protein [Prevotella sp.]
MDKHVISNGATISDGSGSYNGTRLVSYLARVNYDYMNKYFFGASYRIDGSSRLHKDNRWGNFWSVSGAWRITDEDFMDSVKGWLTDAKLRASYGINGTLPSDYYGYMGLSSLTDNYNSEPGIYPSQIENNDLKWEKNYNFNIGADLRFFNRIGLTFEYYTRTTNDLLIDYPISMTTGFSSYLFNIGKVRNQGFEIELSADVIKNKDFSWVSSLNLSHNANEVLELDGTQTEIVSGTQIHKVGKPYRTFYLYEFAGINPDNGNPMFYTNTLDENGNLVKEATEKLDQCNRIEYKNAEASLTGGFINTLRYKWFDLSFNISFQFGGYAHDKWTQKVDHAGTEYDLNIPAYYANAWKKPGDITDIERFNVDAEYTMNDYYQNTRSLHSTDFIRLRNLTFGFSVPKQLLRKIGIEKCRIYASGSNLLTWAKHDYYDPEAVYGGTTIWGTPPLKTLTFGFDLGF